MTAFKAGGISMIASKHLLVDGNNIASRAFHVGNPGAFFSMTAWILDRVKRASPHNVRTFMYLFFDHPDGSFRHLLDANYKAQREPNEEKAKYINELILELYARSFPVIVLPELEADDAIAIFAGSSYLAKGRKYVYSWDRDLLSLVSGDTVVLNDKRVGQDKALVVFNRDAVREKYGIESWQIPDYKALVGDPSDNIKGVEGIGPKKAVKILKKYRTLEDFIEKGKKDPLYKHIVGKEDDAIRAHSLTQLFCELDLDELELGDPETQYLPLCIAPDTQSWYNIGYEVYG